MAKKKFEVMEHETISECLKRMELEGYTPVRRMEEPVFKEVNNGKDVEVCGRKISFIGES